MMYRTIFCAMLLVILVDALAASIETERLSSIVRELASD